jgi:protein O-GlcNAc transferase
MTTTFRSRMLVLGILLVTVISINGQRYDVPIPGHDDPSPTPETKLAPTPEPTPIDPMDRLKAKIAADPNDWLSHNELGALYARRNRNQEATEMFSRAADLKPDDARIWLNLSIVHDRLGNTALALDASTRSLRLRPDDLVTTRQHCELLLAAKQPKPAVACYEKLVNLVPADELAHARYLYALSTANESKRAAAMSKALLERFPSSAEIHNAVGIVNYGRKKYKDAAVNFRRAIELDAKYDAAHYNLAAANLLSNNRTEAVKGYWYIKKRQPGLARRLYEFMYRDLIVSAVNPK